MINLDADNENDENDEEEEEGNWVDYEGGEREDMWVERMRLGMGDRAIISSSKYSLSLCPPLSNIHTLRTEKTFQRTVKTNKIPKEKERQARDKKQRRRGCKWFWEEYKAGGWWEKCNLTRRPLTT